MVMSKIEKYAEDFSWLDDDERLMHLIDLAKRETSLPGELRTDDRLVNGCMSQIWIDVGLQDQVVNVYYDSDAMITKGITSVVADCFSGITVNEAKALTKEDFEKLGIKQLLSAQRRNGLGSLIDTISKKVHRL
jgi:cysteine desulfuration protein SufE